MATNIDPLVSGPATTGPVEPVVTPKPGVEPVGAQAPETAADAGDLPEEVLRLPGIQAIMAGSPPAISSPLKGFEKSQEGKLIIENRDSLMQAGMGFYRSLSGDLGVMFNQLYINGEDIKSADQAGKLLEIAPPAEKVIQDIKKSGKNNPVLTAKTPTGVKQATIPTAPQNATSPVAPAPASVQRKAMQARIQNMAPSAPTQGPKPGAGRLLNSILKPVL